MEATGFIAASTTFELNSSCAFLASLVLLIYFDTRVITAVIATESPKVRVAINAFAATLEIPSATLIRVIAAV